MPFYFAYLFATNDNTDTIKRKEYEVLLFTSYEIQICSLSKC